MAKLATNIFVVGAKRTAFGTYGGKLKHFSSADMGVVAVQGALKSAALDGEHVDHVIFGNVVQAGSDAIYLARHIGLRAGISAKTPALTTNRLCGSSFETIVQACQQIVCGNSKVVVTGGSESMSQPAYVVRGIRFGLPFGKSLSFDDYLWQCFTDWGIDTPMGGTAENLGAMYKVSRDEADEYAHMSQQRWRKANDAGYFRSEIEPIKLKSKKKGEEIFATDEHPRATTPESLAKLLPVFKKDGLVTAGNASGVCDGAASVIIANEEAVQRHHLTPMLRVVAWSSVGCEPSIMGIGPVDAIRNITQLTGIPLDRIDIIEVNEAFAAQILAVKRELKLDNERLNLNGGAIAMGHPLGASGARISAHLAYEMRRRNAKYGIGAACIGGGQGIAILFEKV